MNRDLFSKFIASPAKISAQDIPALETFAEQFPYCQLAHFFVAKPHYDLLTVQAEKRVQRAAVFATSRYKLKKFLEIAGEAVSDQTLDVGPTNLAEVISPLISSPIDELIPQPVPSETTFPLSETNITPEETANQGSPLAETNFTALTEKIKKTKQNEIIDNFIKTEPRISSLANLAKESLAKDLSEGSSKAPAGLVSENLANIMLKQGKTDKAIEIYEKLIVKYPEKKSYFAEKIEILKNN